VSEDDSEPSHVAAAADVRISVIIPAYQAAAHVGEAIRSVLQQDHPATEIIVVDDGSTDQTADAVRAFGPAVTLCSQPNGGEASARNAGWRAATSEWVAYLDADDRFLPGKLAAVAAAIAAEPALAIVTTDAYVEVSGDVTGRCYGPMWSFEREHQREEILRRNFVFGHVCVRRSVLEELGGFDESITHTTDWEMWIRVVLAGGRVELVERPLSVYRVHVGSLSADLVAMAEGSLSTLDAASRSTLLTLRDRQVLAESIDARRAQLERERLTAALAASSPLARSAATSVVADAAQPTRSRVKAGAAWLLPRTFGTAERLRRRGHRIGTMGRFVPAAAVNDLAPDLAGAAAPPRPLVSVVLPFYNEERFLLDAIATVRAQTCTTWELLLVDDGSTDVSAQIADDAAGTDPRIRVLRHPGGSNAGLAASRNLGIAEASAGSVALLDADDSWAPEKLERQLDQLASNPAAAMVCGPTRLVYEDGRSPTLRTVVAGTPRLLPRGGLARRLLLRRLMPPPPSNVMYRRRALVEVGGVPLGDNLYEDQRTFVAVSLRHPVFVGDETLSTYAVRSDSLYGSLHDDPDTKWQQEQRFHRWVVQHGRKEGAQGVALLAALVVRRTAGRATRRFRQAVRVRRS
jgi:glycosyltransferase involved in cell wall biosynthesis